MEPLLGWQQLRGGFLGHLLTLPQTSAQDTSLPPGVSPGMESLAGLLSYSPSASRLKFMLVRENLELYTCDRAGTLGDSWQAPVPHSL